MTTRIDSEVDKPIQTKSEFLTSIELSFSIRSAGAKYVKYKSLRFFIQINELLGWSIIIGGGLFALITAAFVGRVGDAAQAIVVFIFIGAFCTVQGILVFALGNLFECFIDIEENTRRTAAQLKSPNESGLNVENRTEATAENTLSEFSYLCPSCNTFLKSDVLACPTCGTENPHHPSNKEKRETSQAKVASKTAALATQCSRCGAGINQGDNFCSSCGEART